VPATTTYRGPSDGTNQIFDLKGAVVLVELVVEFGVAAFNAHAMSIIRQA
jgi:hypothetical protein